MNDELWVALDVEGVLADTHRAFVATFNEKYDTDHTLASIDTSDWEWVGDLRDFKTFIRLTDQAWKTLPTIEPLETGIDRELERLIDAGYAVDIVTARTGVDNHIRRWLADQGITNYNEFYAVNHSKAEMDYRFYIDDRPGLADDLSEDQHQYVRSQPWNRDVSPHPRATPVATIQAAVDALVTKDGR